MKLQQARAIVSNYDLTITPSEEYDKFVIERRDRKTYKRQYITGSELFKEHFHHDTLRKLCGRARCTTKKEYDRVIRQEKKNA